MDKPTQTLANYTTALDFGLLPASTLREIKRRLIDAIGCGIGGYSSEPAAIAREIASYPKGHAKNPMSDADVESKFADLSKDLLAPARREALLRALWNIDQAGDVGRIMELTRMEPP